MKKLIAATLILASGAASAFATKTVYPTIQLDNGPMVSAGSLCFDGEKLKTVGMLEGCAEYDVIHNDGPERVCVDSFLYVGEAAISGEREECVDYEMVRDSGTPMKVCAETAVVPYSISLTQEATVFSNPKGDRLHDGEELYTFEYTIPNCQ